MKKFLAFLLFLSPCFSEYIHRHTVVAERGGMRFTGNTLGLSKANNKNMAGKWDAIGAYITLDTSLQVGDFPPGTTLDYKKNSSAAHLDLPPGSEVIYAELIWSGSYGYVSSTQGEDPHIVLDPANGPIKFTTPDGATHEIISDPATRQHIKNSDPKITFDAGNYCRSQEVTEIVKQHGSGVYAVGHVPSTISPLDNTHNAAGWSLAVIFKNPAEDIQNMSLFVGCEQASSLSNEPVEVSGFLTPPYGQLSARLHVCGIEGDANKTGDHMSFGPDRTHMSYLSGPNNGENNFFASQINNNQGLLDTTGTFGDRNHNPPKRIVAGRQGFDITCVDCTDTLHNSQTKAFAQGVTDVGGEDYTISGLGIEILVEAPIIDPIKRVNGQVNITSRVGERVNFEIFMTNTGSVRAKDVKMRDELEFALMPVPGSCYVNGNQVANANYFEGVPVGDLDVGETAVLTFDVDIADLPETGNKYENIVSVDYIFKTTPEFALFSADSDLLGDIPFEVFSNVVTIVLPSNFSPGAFTGTLKKCKFLNRSEYSIRSSWTMPEETGVLFYRIYDKDRVIGEIQAGEPLEFNSCLVSKKQGKRLEVAAVYTNFAESVHVPIQILN